MARCLVTGATGFIGTHLVRALIERGDEVVALVQATLASALIESLGARVVHGDVTDADSLTAAVENVDVVYHLAGLTRALGVAQMNRVNEAGAAHVAAACAGCADPPVLVLVSSLAAAGPSVSGEPRETDEPSVPLSHYGRSKRAGELAAVAHADRVPLTIVRPPMVFGEGDKASGEMFRAIARLGVHAIPGLREHKFSLIHATDLVSVLMLAADRGQRVASVDGDRSTSAGDGYYYAVCHADVTYAELGQAIADGLGQKRVRMLRVPLPFVWCLGGFNEIVGQIIRRPAVLGLDKVREAAAGSWTCSPRSVADDLGYQSNATFEARMTQTARWYQEQGWL